MNRFADSIARFFRDGQQARVFGVLVALTIFDGALILFRNYLNRRNITMPDSFYDLVAMRNANLYFLFMAWNLVLAWVPYLAALGFSWLSRGGKSVLRLSLVFVLWLAFFPNAPYIVTDLVHLRERPPVPFWLDLVLLFSSAFTGLMLGLVSLFEVQTGLKRWFSARTVWLISLPIIALCAFGVWLGRFQRWNSWDIVTNPGGLLRDLLHTATHRHELFHAAGITALLTLFLLLGHTMLSAMMRGEGERGG